MPRDDERLARLLREEYRPPPELPEEEVWTGIREELARLDRIDAETTGGPPPAAGRRPGASMGLRVAAAAGLILAGMGMGWLTAPSGEAPAGPGDSFEAPDAAGELPEDEADLAIRRAEAHQHLAESEFLLALVRAEARRGEVGGEVPRWADLLLTDTRALLEDPEISDDRRFRELLADLELVLAQVAHLGEEAEDWPGATAFELQLIAEGLEARDVLPRIHAALPSMDQDGEFEDS